ncbi:MAG: protein kinase [Kofleriaceae bacterium]|nr:protein kinase [Kofleriaceae bacterium]
MLGDLLGRGGMAEVFAGHSHGSHGFQKPVAIKRLLPELANDHVFVERLIGEAKLLVGMQHGNIVSVLDLARDGDDVFLVMEFVDGPSLRQLLKARGSRGLPLGIATYIVQAAAAGLEFAHARPGGAIIHADISPSNLLLTTSGEVRVADFGIARREGNGAGVVEGKWAYMAPEQARGEALTPRSDVFALGVVLYELVTGQHPLGRQVTADERDSGPIRVVPPRVVNPAVPAGLDAICMKALAENARDRYARMQQLIDALIDERFTNQWREGASDLAQAIREVAPGGPGPSTGPRTQHTDRPVTIVTRSLISQSARKSAPRIEEPSHSASRSSASVSGARTSLLEIERPSSASVSGARTSLLEIERPSTSASSSMSASMSGARTSVLEIEMPSASARTSQVEIAQPAMQPMMAPVPMAQVAMAPGAVAMTMPQLAAQLGRMSAAMLPSPELASVHGGNTFTGSHAIDVRDARSNKWAFAVLGIAALVGVIAAIAIQLAPSQNLDTAAARGNAPAETVAVAPTPAIEAPAPAPIAPTVPSNSETVPTTTVPSADVPSTDVPSTEVAATDAPTTDAPATDAATDPSQDSPKARLWRRSLAKVAAKSSPKPTRSGDAILRVNTYDAVYARVTVSGHSMDVPGTEKFKLPAGTHVVKLVNKYLKITRTCPVKLEAGKVRTLKVSMEEGGCEVY